ncbi:hypothetical protein XBJ2_60026 [Xenorhabdus bovienii str. Jollieti]|uniref:Uncharacterized protein n=1 Tax=Xenorhabdus bovienii (strain SS-2004) TaxID=406818 RepID=D3UYF0_XENBS|nr:hypothetical protein XBJ1_0177 [Xenorhabdus bovienii SS-2004]CDH30170.1 hypothetical protein XBJ2_60026 [Xenorhabdus bovienii str. Jollieti]
MRFYCIEISWVFSLYHSTEFNLTGPKSKWATVRLSLNYYFLVYLLFLDSRMPINFLYSGLTSPETISPLG